MPRTTERFVVLDGLRGICALAVMVFHYTGQSWQAFPNSAIAVDLFFMLSGFVLCASYGARVNDGTLSWGRLITKRVIRLYPMFFIGLALGCVSLFVLKHFGHTKMGTREILGTTIWNALFLPFLNRFEVANFENSWASTGSVAPGDFSLWSLFFEMFVSVVMISFLRSTRSQLAKTATAVAVVWIIMALSLSFATYEKSLAIGGGNNSTNFMLGFPRVIFGFSVGVLAYRLTEANSPYLARIAAFRSRCLWLGSSPIVLGIVLIALLSLPTLILGASYTLCVLCVCPMILLLGAGMAARSKAVTTACNALGWLSYPLYCVHAPIGNLVAIWRHQFGGLNLVPGPFPIVASVVSVVVAIGMGLLLDEPIRKFLTDVFEGRRLRAPLGRSVRSDL